MSFIKAITDKETKLYIQFKYKTQKGVILK